MDKQFLNEEGLQSVADNVNKRLKTVETMPVNPKSEQVVLYTGATSGDFVQGHIYEYNSETYYCYIAEDGGYYYHFYIKEIEAGATVYACGSPEWFQKKADSISELTSDFSEIGYTFSITAASPSSITVSNGGLSIVAGRSSDDDLSNVGWTDITSSGTVDLSFNPISSNAQSGVAVNEAKTVLFNKLFKIDTWEDKSWQGFDQIIGDNIWTDGTNIYYSSNLDQYVLNKETSTWESKTWNGCSEFLGSAIWKVGNNIYLSNPTQSGEENYVLDKATSTWEEKVWNNKQEGYNIWKDSEGTIYNSFKQKLDVATDTWEDLEVFSPDEYADTRDLFFYKNNVYFISYTKTYLFNHSTRTWSDAFVSWRSLSITGSYIWTDSVNIYYSQDSKQYVLNQKTDEWENMNWKGDTEHLKGVYIWTDNESIYCSDYYQWSSPYNYQVKLSKTLKTYID